MVYRTHGKREVSSFNKMGIEIGSHDQLQSDQPQQPLADASPTKKVFGGPLSTDINSYYGPTVGDGEEDLDDPWDDNDTHDHEELVDESISNTNTNTNNNEGEGDGDDSEVEDKFQCRPRYQHTRVDVSLTSLTIFFSFNKIW